MRHIFLPRLAGRNAGSESLADVGVIEPAVELRVGQQQTGCADVVGGIHYRTQVGAIIWWGRQGLFAPARIAGRDRLPPAPSASGAMAWVAGCGGPGGARRRCGSRPG